MRKKLWILGMITCMLALSACGAAEKAEKEPFMSEEDAVFNAENIVELMADVVAQDAVEDFTAQYDTGYPAVAAGLRSWVSAQEDLGDYIGIIGSEISYADDKVTVILTVDGSLHDAEVEVVMDEMAYVSITTNVQYSFGELMTNAALNTILGMGTVFLVLVLIAFIIYLFGYIPKIQESFARKGEAQTPVKEAIDNSVAQIAAKEEEEPEDDLELVAVIAAAVAASEGQASTDGFVVRSIRKRY